MVEESQQQRACQVTSLFGGSKGRTRYELIIPFDVCEKEEVWRENMYEKTRFVDETKFMGALVMFGESRRFVSSFGEVLFSLVVFGKVLVSSAKFGGRVLANFGERVLGNFA